MTSETGGLPIQLDGQAVIVTGAGRGLGAAYAHELARRGARLIVNDVESAAVQALVEALRGDGGEAVGQVGSVADPDTAEALVARCLEEFGTIDGLVNNAGILRSARLWEMDDRTWADVVAVNLSGTFYCARAAARQMRAQRRGAIVNVASHAALGQSGLGSYAASKGGVIALTYAWALELAPAGVRVNALFPAAETPIYDDLQRFAESRPARSRLPAPERAAPLVSYLLSDAAARVSGQCFALGGRTLSLLTHMKPLRTVRAAEPWTAEAIAQAVASEFAPLFEPVHYQDTTYHWAERAPSNEQ